MAQDTVVTINPLSQTIQIDSLNCDSLKQQYLVLDSNFKMLNQQYSAFTDRQYSAMKVHKTLAFTTGGLLLAADGMGLYHLLSMKKQGHDYREQVGMNLENQTNGMQDTWQSDKSQSERVIHAGLVTMGTITYTATAAIELALPNISTSTKKTSNTALHRKAFYVHAGLMASNIVLGLLTSYGLSEGKHEMVQVTGIAHLVVGFAAPVSMMAAGMIFKIPNEY